MCSAQVRGHFITQATAWRQVTEVGGVGNAATDFTGALLLGNGVVEKVAI